MESEPPEATLVSLETDAVGVVGKDWYSRLDKTVTSNLGKYRKYKGNSVRDLLRAMRNKVSAVFSRTLQFVPHFPTSNERRGSCCEGERSLDWTNGRNITTKI